MGAVSPATIYAAIRAGALLFALRERRDNPERRVEVRFLGPEVIAGGLAARKNDPLIPNHRETGFCALELRDIPADLLALEGGWIFFAVVCRSSRTLQLKKPSEFQQFDFDSRGVFSASRSREAIARSRSSECSDLLLLRLSRRV